MITVWAVPGSSATGIAGRHGDAIRVRVAAPPERGRANDAIAVLLRSITGARRVELVAGQTSRRKRFVAFGVDPERAGARLDQVIREQSGDTLR